MSAHIAMEAHLTNESANGRPARQGGLDPLVLPVELTDGFAERHAPRSACEATRVG